jgi:fatty acid-binding protein DegV
MKKEFCTIEQALVEFRKTPMTFVPDERSYSEEDMIDFAHFYFTEEFNSSMQTSKSTKDIFKEWFEQFKKK